MAIRNSFLTTLFFLFYILGPVPYAQAVEFDAPKVLTGNLSPFSLTAADFDGVNGPDIAIANNNYHVVSIYLNNGDGTYSDKVDYSSSNNPIFITSADYDGINGPDLAVIGGVTGTVGVFLNNGDGTFAARVEYTAGFTPRWIASADLDGINGVDMVVSNELSHSVSVFLNNGDGTFAAKVDYATGNNPMSVAIGNFDGAAGPDIVVANTASGTISILPNNGDGSFGTKVDFATGLSPRSLAVADLDGVNGDDVVVGNFSGTSISVFLNNGDGTATRTDYATGTSPKSISIADIDGANGPDLAVINQNGDTVSIYINNGAGAFAAKVDYATGDGPQGLASADLDGANGPDLVIGNVLSASITLMLNSGSGTFATGTTYATGISPKAVTHLDADGASGLDLAVTNFSDNTVSLFLNNGDGTYAPKQDFAVGLGPISITSADFDSINGPDAAITNYNDNTITVLINKADGTVTRYDYGSGSNPTAITSMDADGVNGLDLAVVNFNSNTVSVYLNHGDGTHANKIDYATQALPSGVASADLDGNNGPDLAVANAGSNSISIFYNNGDGSYAAKTDFATCASPRYITTADFDNSGSPDLAISCPAGKKIHVLLNNDNGTYTSIYLSSAATVGSLASADFDGVNGPDLVTTNPSSHSVSVFMNNGAGGFLPGKVFGAGASPEGVTAADLDGTNGPDIVVTTSSGNLVRVILNKSPDIVPDPFAFTEQTGVATGIVVESNAITVTGIAAPTPITISGGEYAVSTDSGASWSGWLSTVGTVNSGDQVKLRVTSASTPNTTVAATVNIGGVAGIFYVTTRANNAPVISGTPATSVLQDALYDFLPGSGDTDGDPLTFAITNKPGWATFDNATGRLSGTPGNGDVGIYSNIGISVSDGYTSTALPGFSITVANVNDPPVANNQSVTTNEDTATAVVLSGTDIDVGDTLVYSVATSPSNGTLSGTVPNLVYTPSANFNGTDSFTFTVNDGAVTSAPATVSITINPVNDVPIASDSSFTVLPGSSYSGTLSANDIDSAVLSYSIVANGSRGTVVIDNVTTGAFTYTPSPSEAGPDSFTFKVNDGSVDSNIATVTVDISVPGNTAPTAPGLVSPTDNATGITAASVTFEWQASTDADGDTLGYDITVCTDNTFANCSPVAVAWYQDNGILLAGIGGGNLLLLIGLLGGFTRNHRIHTAIGTVLLTLVLSACGGGGGGSGGGTTPPAPNPSHTVTGLNPGTTYYWKVTAKDGRGGITDSVVWSFTTAP